MSSDIFEQVVERLNASLDTNGSHLQMESLVFSDDAGVRIHQFSAPRLVDLRSIAKPIACLALGSAIGKGLQFGGTRITLDTPVWPLLGAYVEVRDRKTRAGWKQVRIRDLLRITLGHDQGLMFSKDIRGLDPDSLIDYVVNYPITRKVGKEFVYSNAGTFVLSTLITEHLGFGLDEFVATHLFNALGIYDFTWSKYGKYTAGCTGLRMRNEDLHRIGQLLLHDGVSAGEQLVPADFVQAMRTPQVPAPTHRYVARRAFPKWSYGYNLWICPDGVYYCDGSDGQYLIVIPQRRRVVSATGFQPDSVPVSDALGLFK